MRSGEEIIAELDRRRLTEEEAERAMKIVDGFFGWTLETGPCPIQASDRVWFKRVCAMAERQAKLETELAAATAPKREPASTPAPGM